MPLEGVIFDFDGVIVDTEHLWEGTWASYAQRAGYTWTSADTHTVQGMSTPEWSDYLAARLAETTGVSADPETVRDEAVQLMVDTVLGAPDVMLPGARELVTDTARRAPTAIASSAPRRLITALLAEHHLDGFFGAVCSSEEVERGKPSPDVYLEAARRLGVDPRRCVAIEDSSNGMRSVVAAGLRLMAVPNPVYPPAADALALAEFVAPDHTSARGYVAGLLGDPDQAQEENQR